MIEVTAIEDIDGRVRDIVGVHGVVAPVQVLFLVGLIVTPTLVKTPVNVLVIVPISLLAVALILVVPGPMFREIVLFLARRQLGNGPVFPAQEASRNLVDQFQEIRPLEGHALVLAQHLVRVLVDGLEVL